MKDSGEQLLNPIFGYLIYKRWDKAMAKSFFKILKCNLLVSTILKR